MNSSCAGGDADAISDELVGEVEVPKVDKIRVEGGAGHSDARGETGPAVSGFRIENIEIRDRGLYRIAKPAEPPQKLILFST